MDFTNGMKKAFLASVGAAATTAEVTKDILEKMIEKGERTVEHGKVLNQELKHNACLLYTSSCGDRINTFW